MYVAQFINELSQFGVTYYDLLLDDDEDIYPPYRVTVKFHKLPEDITDEDKTSVADPIAARAVDEFDNPVEHVSETARLQEQIVELQARVEDAKKVVQLYSISVTTENGSVSLSPDDSTYIAGETVVLEAFPDKGFEFIEWQGDLSGSGNPTKLVMDSDKTVVASFVSTSNYIITIEVKDGTITVDPAKEFYTAGETITLEAIPDKGFQFVSWGGDVSGKTNPLEIKVESDLFISAIFQTEEIKVEPLVDPVIKPVVDPVIKPVVKGK